MKTVYRLLRKPFAAAPFDGEGSFRYGGRWSSPGTRVVYTAEHLSLAMMEYLVHVDAGRPPRDLMLARAEIPEDVVRVRLGVEDLPADWRKYPAPGSLQSIGDRFVAEGKACVLIVPSVLAYTDDNYILNPAHPEFALLKLYAAELFEYDARLVRV